jgi:hypothetical protein
LRGERLPERVAFVIAGFAMLLAMGVGFFALILNAILYGLAASASRAYARCEDE